MEIKPHIFALHPDAETLKQFKHCYSQPFVVKAALMPDAHSGYVAPVGAVLLTKGYIVPSWVGFDIGCGVSAVRLSGKYLDLIRRHQDAIYDAVKKRVPMGLGNLRHRSAISATTKESFQRLVTTFKKGAYNKDVARFLEHGKALLHLGTLGHGNHFIEISHSDKGDSWIVVHSGSRGVGHLVAEHYMKKSSGKKEDFEKTYPLEVKSDLGKEYLNALDFCLEFALLNRMEIIREVVAALESVLKKKISWKLWVNKNHNHALQEGRYFIHRKGATPAKKGERGVIPGNMKDGCYLVIGKGNKQFLESTSHGAGRQYSRSAARKTFTLAEFKEVMKGVKAAVSDAFLDEVPMAYKNIGEVMKAQEKSAKIVMHLRPVINWKG